MAVQELQVQGVTASAFYEKYVTLRGNIRKLGAQGAGSQRSSDSAAGHPDRSRRFLDIPKRDTAKYMACHDVCEGSECGHKHSMRCERDRRGHHYCYIDKEKQDGGPVSQPNQ